MGKLTGLQTSWRGIGLVFLGVCLIGGSAQAEGPVETPSAASAAPVATATISRNGLIRAIRNREDSNTPYRQGFLVAAMMLDLQALQQTSTPVVPDRAQAPWWPMDVRGRLWRSEHGSGSDLLRPGAEAAMGQPRVVVDPTRYAVDPQLIADWFEPQPAQLAATVPLLVWQARSLLRPVQVWQMSYGDHSVSMGFAYMQQKLALNPSFVAQMHREFDTVEFYRFVRPDANYGIHLTQGNSEWLWVTGRPSLNQAGEFAFELYTDAAALKYLTNPPLPIVETSASPMEQYLQREQYRAEVLPYGDLDQLAIECHGAGLHWRP